MVLCPKWVPYDAFVVVVVVVVGIEVMVAIHSIKVCPSSGNDESRCDRCDGQPDVLYQLYASYYSGLAKVASHTVIHARG